MQCLKFSIPNHPTSSLRNSKPALCPFIYSSKKSYFACWKYIEHFCIFSSPREQGSPKGLDCRVHAPLTLARALLCYFLPGLSVHSIMLVLGEQVSHCSQKFMPGSSHLAAGNTSKSDQTTEVLAGKGSSPAPSSPAYQRLRLVSGQHQLRQGLSPISHCTCTV